MESLKLNILASAYKCTPDKDSESEVGWQWIYNLGRYHRITAITRKHGNSALIRRLLEEGCSDVRFEYYELPHWLSFLEKGNISHFIYYSFWQFGAFLTARKIIAKEKYDLVHHFVFVNTWQPTYMAFLKIPFYFGPIGENAPMPYRIVKRYGVRIVFSERLGSFIKSVSKKYNPLMRAVYNKAVRVILINSAIKDSLHPRVQKKCFVQAAVGVPAGRIVLEKDNPGHTNMFKVLFVGRYIYRKAPDIALAAFLKFAKNHQGIELTMIGGGKMLPDLEKLILRNPQCKSVKILGWLDRERVDEHIKNCDIFIFPTFEGGGAVLLEAMSLGKPIVCLDFGGPSDFISVECGIKVKVTNRTQIINDLAEALEKLYGSKELRRNLGSAGKIRVEATYAWEKKAQWMNSLYRESLSKYKSIANENDSIQKT